MAIYLGVINGVEYLLEAPSVGDFVHIRPVYFTNGGSPADSVLHRYWTLLFSTAEPLYLHERPDCG